MFFNKYFYIIRYLRRLPVFFYQYYKFKKGVPDWPCRLIDALPIFHERTSVMSFDAHYVYHTGWAARILREISPVRHVDISSSIMFSSIVSSFLPINHYDYRAPILTLDGLECGNQDLLNLRFENSSISSLSCMHVIEHVGLGRYGDPINPRGDIEAAKELMRVLAPGGHLIIVVPLAERAHVRFNGHRIYDLNRVLAMFEGLELKEFTFLNDKNNKFTRHASKDDIVGSHYGCGCFVFRIPLKIDNE